MKAMILIVTGNVIAPVAIAVIVRYADAIELFANEHAVAVGSTLILASFIGTIAFALYLKRTFQI